MKKILLICCLIGASYNHLCAQEDLSKLSLSGFKVNLVPSHESSIKYHDNVEIKTTVKNGITEILVIDQRGKVPKSEITIYTDNLSYLDLHNCSLVMESVLKTDSLKFIANCSFGTLKINSDYFDINTGGGAQMKVEGKAKSMDCAVGAGSNLNADKLHVDNARVHAMGHSSLKLNADNLEIEKQENATIKNVNKK